MLIDLPLGDFLDELAADSPAPGGGSVAALAGALAAALAMMVANLSAGAEGTGHIQSRGGELLGSLKRCIDEDTAAFNAVMAAFKLPKTTTEEKALRSGAIQEAMKKAAALPMEAAGFCVLAMELALDALRCGKASTASDAAVAGRMAYAGLWGAVYNVRINLASITDGDFCAAARDQVHALLDKSQELHAILTALADEKIAQ